ncbi:MAG: hypothetical protein IKO32_11225 [Lachnospiraceae bacterium]|nr:hypothetical protein [Lachnospiraceae bacterium]
MSIKAVSEIPMTLQEKRQSYREMIRKDIQEAIDNHIERFEFEGDYNWKYLAQYAREEADIIWRKTVYYDTAKKVRAELLKDRPGENYISMRSGYDYKGEWIKIRTKKGEDRIHVYAEINFEFAKNFYNRLMADTLEHQKVIAARKAEREKYLNERKQK